MCDLCYLLCDNMWSLFLDNLPDPKTTIDGDKKTVVSYKAEDGKIKKVSFSLGGILYTLIWTHYHIR